MPVDDEFSSALKSDGIRDPGEDIPKGIVILTDAHRRRQDKMNAKQKLKLL